jgi:hypothetical protein
MIYGIPVEKLTAPVLLGITILLILTGLLVPRRTYKDKAQESERYREAFETEREARMISDRQTSQLLEGQKAQHAMIVAIFENSKVIRDRESGGRDVAS